MKPGSGNRSPDPTRPFRSLREQNRCFKFPHGLLSHCLYYKSRYKIFQP